MIGDITEEFLEMRQGTRKIQDEGFDKETNKLKLDMNMLEN